MESMGNKKIYILAKPLHLPITHNNTYNLKTSDLPETYAHILTSLPELGGKREEVGDKETKFCVGYIIPDYRQHPTPRKAIVVTVKTHNTCRVVGDEGLQATSNSSYSYHCKYINNLCPIIQMHLQY